MVGIILLGMLGAPEKESLLESAEPLVCNIIRIRNYLTAANSDSNVVPHYYHLEYLLLPVLVRHVQLV